MARGLVQPRPFVKKKSSTPSFSAGRIIWSKRANTIQKNWFLLLVAKSYAGWVIVSIILILLGLFFLKGTWYNPNYLIQNITYSPETRAQYENTELFVLTSKYLRGQYLNTIQLGEKGKILSKIQEQYPFVRNIKIEYQSPQSIKVDFTFDYPKFRVKIGEKFWGVWNGKNTEELQSWRALAQTGVTIDTPAYLSGTERLSGFFYEVNFERYEQNIPKIKQTFTNIERFVYLAGSPNFIVFENGKTIYLHRDNLDYQLQKYLWLKNNYKNFAGIYEIDLGSQTQNRVIIKE